MTDVASNPVPPPTDQGSGQDMREIERLLQAELDKEREGNKKTLMYGGILVVLVAGYLTWSFRQISKVLDPEALAQATTGFAVDAIPAAGKSLRSLVVDGAPNIAQMAGESLIDLIPSYRLDLENQIAPIIDDASGTLADAWLKAMLESAQKEEHKRPFADKLALAKASNAFVTRTQGLLDAAMNEPGADGRTPRQIIDGSLKKLAMIDEGLKKVAQKRGDPKERELLIAWMSLIDRYSGHAIGVNRADKVGKGPAPVAPPARPSKKK